MAWSYVGNPGNAPDPATGSRYGAVPYAYSIGAYDVTFSEYATFLNSNDPTGADPLDLYNLNMGNATYGGIAYNPVTANGSKYSVISGDGNHPAVFVNWYDAVRFSNWLNSGQVPGSTETGAYTLGPLGAAGIPINGDSITRNAGATVFLPTENEWYKAAYYNPATSSYYLYPTSSNAVPNASGPTATPNSANYNSSLGGGLTDVGAYSGTTSPYGAYDMGGDVWQLNESFVFSTLTRGIRGGGFYFTADAMASSTRENSDPTYSNDVTGFRVASIPEPSTIVLAALGVLAVLAYRWRMA